MYSFLGTQLRLHNINSKAQVVYKNRLQDIGERGGNGKKKKKKKKKKKSKNAWKYEVIIEASKPEQSLWELQGKVLR